MRRQLSLAAANGFFIKLCGFEVVANYPEIRKAEFFQAVRCIASAELLHGQASFVFGHWR
ncbi:hypothetical protein D3C86_2213620 [compost metagenome]